MRLFTMVLFLLMAVACYYENEESLFADENPACDTTLPGYASDIQPVLSSRCYSCHSSSSAALYGGGIDLEDFTHIQARIEDGSLWGSLNHQNGFAPMPQGGGKLDSCTLKQFKIWIDAGYPLN